MSRITLPFCLIVFFVAGCGVSQDEIANGDDPIAALSSTVESSRYGQKFWSEERDSKSDVWTEALRKCGAAEAADYPTCKIVREAAFFTPHEAPAVDPRSVPGFGDF